MNTVRIITSTRLSNVILMWGQRLTMRLNCGWLSNGSVSWDRSKRRSSIKKRSHKCENTMQLNRTFSHQQSLFLLWAWSFLPLGEQSPMIRTTSVWMGKKSTSSGRFFNSIKQVVPWRTSSRRCHSSTLIKDLLPTRCFNISSYRQVETWRKSSRTK